MLCPRLSRLKAFRSFSSSSQPCVRDAQTSLVKQQNFLLRGDEADAPFFSGPPSWSPMRCRTLLRLLELVAEKPWESDPKLDPTKDPKYNPTKDPKYDPSNDPKV